MNKELSYLEKKQYDQIRIKLSKYKDQSEDESDQLKRKACDYILLLLYKKDGLEKSFPFFMSKYNEEVKEWGRYLDDQNSSGKELQFDYLFLSLMVFVGEYDLWLKRHNEKDHAIEKIWDKFLRDTDNETYHVKESLIDYAQYIRKDLQLDILNSYFGTKDFQAFLNYEDKVQDSENKLKKLESCIEIANNQAKKDIEEREKKVQELKVALEKYETAFNFVGLSKGFETILSKKQESKKRTLNWLRGAAFLALLPLVLSFCKFIQGEELSWQKMLPVIGLEFVLIYFFRVVLAHYNSIQTQIMQLELRQSLCQFIQNYAEYAKEMKSNDGVSLEKFENLIFSSILSNPDKVPGTFDGVEGLTALVKELRGGK